MKSTATFSFCVYFIILLASCISHDEPIPDPDNDYPIFVMPNVNLSWELVSQGRELQFDEIFFTEDHAVIGLKDGKLIIAKDSCKQWHLAPIERVSKFYFINSNVGYAVENYIDFDGQSSHEGHCEIYFTTDGGYSFKKGKRLEFTYVHQIFAHEDSVFISGIDYSSKEEFIRTLDPSLNNMVSTSNNHPALNKHEKSGNAYLFSNINDGNLNIKKYEDDLFDSYNFQVITNNDNRYHTYFSDKNSAYYFDNDLHKIDLETGNSSIIFNSTWSNGLFGQLFHDQNTTLVAYSSEYAYGVYQIEQDTFFTDLRQSFENDSTGFSTRTNMNVLRMKSLYNNKWLYLFSEEGKIWRRRI